MGAISHLRLAAAIAGSERSAFEVRLFVVPDDFLSASLNRPVNHLPSERKRGFSPAPRTFWGSIYSQWPAGSSITNQQHSGPRKMEAGAFCRAGRGQGQAPSLRPPQLSGPLVTRNEPRGFLLPISLVLLVCVCVCDGESVEQLREPLHPRLRTIWGLSWGNTATQVVPGFAWSTVSNLHSLARPWKPLLLPLSDSMPR